MTKNPSQAKHPAKGGSLPWHERRFLAAAKTHLRAFDTTERGEGGTEGECISIVLWNPVFSSHGGGYLSLDKRIMSPGKATVWWLHWWPPPLPPFLSRTTATTARRLPTYAAPDTPTLLLSLGHHTGTYIR